MNIKYILGIALWIAIIACAIEANATKAQYYSDLTLTNQEISSEALSIPFLDEKGEPLILDNSDGTIRIVHFWATWCSDCLGEITALDRLQHHFRKQPLQVIAISEDFKATETVREFYSKEGIKNLPLYMDDRMKLLEGFKFTSLPSTVILDVSGNILAFAIGPVDWDNMQIRDTIKQMLPRS